MMLFFMTITITISSHIWCTSFDVLFRNVATLNCPLSQFFRCKL
jgi:hypothetical protein